MIMGKQTGSRGGQGRPGGCRMKIGVLGYDDRINEQEIISSRGTDEHDTRGYAANDDSNSEGREVGANEWECGKEEAI